MDIQQNVNERFIKSMFLGSAWLFFWKCSLIILARLFDTGRQNASFCEALF